MFRPKLSFLVGEDIGNVGSADNEFFLYTDGASKGNPGKAGAGAVIYDSKKKEIIGESKFLGVRTNNEAEYEALLLGIDMCQALGIDTSLVNLRADSEIMIKQLTGTYRARNERLKAMYEKAKKFKFKTVEHVLREFNKRADELANQGVASE
jgi:ribonuclease HI